MLRVDDVAASSQLEVEEHGALAEATLMTIHSCMMVVQAESRRAPTAPTEPELQWVDDDVLNLLDHDSMLQYAIMARDAYFRLH